MGISRNGEHLPRNHVVLTPRQLEVLRDLQAGLTEKEIAARLGISRHTVHEHVKGIYARLGISNRLQLVALLHRQTSPGATSESAVMRRVARPPR